MKLENLHEDLSKLNIPVAYTYFEDHVSPPFAVFFEESEKHFVADNNIYATKKAIVVELYTTKKDLVLEKKLESFFYKHEIIWESTSQYINEENLFLKAYYFELLEDKKNE